MASLERYRAARQLAEIHTALGDPESARRYHRDAELIRGHVEEVFRSPKRTCGWLRAATGVSGEAYIWGTLYALYLDILSPATRKRAVDQVLQDLETGQIMFKGALRHVPLNRDALPTSAWEKSITPHNRYQNGAFWHTPAGWLIAVLDRDHPQKAQAVFAEYMAHMRREDFRQGGSCSPPGSASVGRESQSKSGLCPLGGLAVRHFVQATLSIATFRASFFCWRAKYETVGSQPHYPGFAGLRGKAEQVSAAALRPLDVEGLANQGRGVPGDYQSATRLGHHRFRFGRLPEDRFGDHYHPQRGV